MTKQFPADLVTFTEEIFNGIFHFLCSAFTGPVYEGFAPLFWRCENVTKSYYFEPVWIILKLYIVFTQLLYLRSFSFLPSICWHLFSLVRRRVWLVVCPAISSFNVFIHTLQFLSLLRHSREITFFNSFWLLHKYPYIPKKLVSIYLVRLKGN